MVLRLEVKVVWCWLVGKRRRGSGRGCHRPRINTNRRRVERDQCVCDEPGGLGELFASYLPGAVIFIGRAIRPKGIPQIAALVGITAGVRAWHFPGVKLAGRYGQREASFTSQVLSSTPGCRGPAALSIPLSLSLAIFSPPSPLHRLANTRSKSANSCSSRRALVCHQASSQPWPAWCARRASSAFTTVSARRSCAR